MSGSDREIVELQTTLSVIHLELKNLTEHLELQVSNYASVLDKFIKLTNQSSENKNKKISELELENAKLKNALTSDDELPDVYKQE
ncbi:MAG: hypothetical protein ABW185_00250 [Sedimenticola sp.]